jgi:hypothetical protein
MKELFLIPIVLLPLTSFVISNRAMAGEGPCGPFPCQYGAVSETLEVTGGGIEVQPLLSKVTNGGSSLPIGATKACFVFTGGIDEYMGHQLIGHHATMFTVGVPNVETLERLSQQAEQGNFGTSPGTNADASSVIYLAYIGSDQRQVLLKKLGYQSDVTNISSSAGKLVEFLDVNCR